MFQFSHLPSNSSGADVQTFFLPTSNAGLGWHTWTKPRGKVMGDFLLWSGAGGGGAGFTGIAGSARGGGGGGCSSAFAHLTVPLIYMPDRLYIQIGAGGLGVTSGTAGVGVISYITCNPNTNPAANGTHVLTSAGTIGTGAASGSAIGGGNGGGAGTVSALSVCNFAGLGQVTFILGTPGSLGGSHTGATGPSTPNPSTGSMFYPGGGGAGTTSADFAGGLQTGSGILADVVSAAALAGSNDGAGGRLIGPPIYPFFGMNGQGGASSNAGPGGNGGNGAPGCGGGGGGGGTTGGRGGDGGPGGAIMICW